MSERTWYYYWEKETRKFVGITSNLIGSDSFIHQKIEIPKCPLEDGWYLVRPKSNSVKVIREKRGDTAYDLDGDEMNNWGWYTILKKITMEDIDE